MLKILHCKRYNLGLCFGALKKTIETKTLHWNCITLSALTSQFESLSRSFLSETGLVLAVFLSNVFQKLVAHQKIIFCDYLFQFFLDDSSFSFFHDFTGFFIVFFKWKDPQFSRNDTDGKCSLNLFWGTWNLMVLKIHENMLSVIWKMDI